jgi:CheY-like chemotaxis protein
MVAPRSIKDAIPRGEFFSFSRLGSLPVTAAKDHILDTLATYLKIRQVDSERAPDGQVAAEMLRVRSFDAVISDVRMPRMDGMQLYESARQIDPRYEKQFIFMSGYLMSEKVRAFIAKSGVACVGKPFSFEDLDLALAPFLTRKTI